MKLFIYYFRMGSGDEYLKYKEGYYYKFYKLKYFYFYLSLGINGKFDFKFCISLFKYVGDGDKNVEKIKYDVKKFYRSFYINSDNFLRKRFLSLLGLLENIDM